MQWKRYPSCFLWPLWCPLHCRSLSRSCTCLCTSALTALQDVVLDHLHICIHSLKELWQPWSLPAYLMLPACCNCRLTGFFQRDRYTDRRLLQLQRLKSCLPDEELKQMQSIVAAHRKRLPNKQPVRVQVQALHASSVVTKLLCSCACGSCALSVSLCMEQVHKSGSSSTLTAVAAAGLERH